MSQRIQKIQQRHPATAQAEVGQLHRIHPTPAKALGRAGDVVALASDIQVLQSAYLVGKRKPVSELPRIWRWLARKAYQYTGWASDYGIESQAICTSRELADEMVVNGGPNWFVQELPINTPLPDETCKFRLMTFPGSDAVAVYDHRHAPFIAVPRKDVAELANVEKRLDELHESLEGKCARAL